MSKRSTQPKNYLINLPGLTQFHVDCRSGISLQQLSEFFDSYLAALKFVPATETRLPQDVSANRAMLYLLKMLNANHGSRKQRLRIHGERSNKCRQKQPKWYATLDK
jgi:hypothetical protein